VIVESPALAGLPGIRHAFFTRQGGVSEGIYGSLNGGLGSSDERDRVVENRARMAAGLGVGPDSLVSLHQVHSPDAVIVEAPFGMERPKADGMATRVPGLALAITTADCGPLLFVDRESGIVGAAHAGWRGAFTGVIEATLAAMEVLGARRDQTTVVLGPTIGRDAYEVGLDFKDRFLEADAANERFFVSSERTDRAMFDLPSYIGARAVAAGVGSFSALDLCTYSDEERFYSYRRTTHRGEPDYGRLISAIALTD
jgi:purine-nucleoside/S-methyl-5'-thioadenosine phosphorylase / adenosine deaminase